MLFVQVAQAQKTGFGSHGGRLKTTGNYKVELFGCDDHVEIYLFDRDTNAINNNDITGSVEFFFNGSATLVSTMARYGVDGFTAKIPSINFMYSKPSFNVHATFIVTEKFDNECLQPR
jgi:hypothetical protein